MSTYSYLDQSMLPPADRELASAGAAASLAHAGYTTRKINKVETEHPLRNPQLTAASSQAAYLAGRSRNAKPPDEKPIDQEINPKGSAGARLAATGALSQSRTTAESVSPASDKSRGLTHAVTAASASHRMSLAPATVLEEYEVPLDARKIHEAAVANTQRELHQEEDILHEKAVAMARQMFSVMPQAEGGAAPATSRRPESTMMARPLSLHETAQRLASETLAKMHDEQKAFRDYYNAAIPPKRQSSVYSKYRKRSASDSSARDMDQEQSAKIRSQMTTFQGKMSKIEAEKMARDREALMEAAKKNADAVIDDVERRIYESTGRPQARLIEKYINRPVNDEDSKPVPIGAGHFVTQREVDRLAQSKTKPIIDDVTRRAEEARARAIEEELDERQARRQRDLEREREEEVRKSLEEAAEVERKSAKSEKERQRVLNHLSKTSGSVLSRRKSSKAQEKVPAKEEAPASAPVNDRQAPHDEEKIEDRTDPTEKQNYPPRTHLATPSAGESALLEPPVGEGDAGRRSHNAAVRRKNAPEVPPVVAPAVVPTNRALGTEESPTSLPVGPAARQWSSSTEGSRVATEQQQQQQQQSQGGSLSRRRLSRRRSATPKWHLRFFNKSSRISTSGAAPGSFEVQREQAIILTPAGGATGATTRSEATSEPLQTIPPLQKSSVDPTPATNPSKFTENL
ncbi:hypothetical protein ACJ72_03910 [Emergomyces africanus]|uniref:Eisosome protein 1 n=1 Tax=Emergomyces africanus TaxID=1955775 RepID=A0A1B7NYD4_9EURO|nr:hypothetical protein ACJ72_03910 [Emergomyces africanus]